MNRKQALPYVSYCVTDSLNEMPLSAMPANARLVGWQCGFEPLFVAVWSYLPNVTLDDDEAEELAIDLLVEKRWFASDSHDADYVL